MTYRLTCTTCGVTHDDRDYLVECCPDGLLVSDFASTRPTSDGGDGIWRFAPWLPVAAPGRSSAGSVTYRSEGLAARLGLDRLWISFNGFWPERDAYCPTCSFKDLEAAPSLQRLSEKGRRGVLVATAGNTGRAFAHLGAEVGFPVVVLVAERHAHRMWRPSAPHAATTMVVEIAEAEYNDVIEIAARVAPLVDLELEGGVRNVARRDGIGTLLLVAVEAIGGLPRHYFQAVGGGPGPIGVYETASRVIASGWATGGLPQFHLAQNDVHCPVHRAWVAGRREIHPEDLPREMADAFADVLVHKAPAYGVRGGLADVLRSTNGRTYAVPAAAGSHGQDLFLECEGVDVMEPAGVAVAALQQAVDGGSIPADEDVLLAVTGGGERRLRREVKVFPQSGSPVLDQANAMVELPSMIERWLDAGCQ